VSGTPSIRFVEKFAIALVPACSAVEVIFSRDAKISSGLARFQIPL
jgi:hypothetical protein